MLAGDLARRASARPRVPGSDALALSGAVRVAGAPVVSLVGTVRGVLGSLTTSAALDRPDLLAAPVASALVALPPTTGRQVLVAEIDPELADTAAFCAHYGVTPEQSANCVVVAGRRGETTTLAACLVLATTRADVNGLVRRRLDARKASFAPMGTAVQASGMEHGGITPVGLPAAWPLLVDAAVLAQPWVVVGSGLRRSKLVLPGALLAAVAGAEVVEGLGQPVRA